MVRTNFLKVSISESLQPTALYHKHLIHMFATIMANIHGVIAMSKVLWLLYVRNWELDIEAICEIRAYLSIC